MMTKLPRRTTLALAAILSLAACDRASQAPTMNAAALSDDDRGAKAGRFLPPTDNSMDANDSAAGNASNESAS